MTVKRPAEITLLSLLLLASPVALAESGQVIDEVTRAPLEGVFVVAAYQADVPNPAIAVTRCYHSEITVTDKQGHFKIPTFTGNLSPGLINRRHDLSFFKEGYTLVNGQKEKTSPVRMGPITSVEWRFDSYQTMHGCNLEQDRAKFLPLSQAVLAEASKLAATREQHLFVLGMTFRVEFLTLGSEIASRNDAKRIANTPYEQGGAPQR